MPLWTEPCEHTPTIMHEVIQPPRAQQGADSVISSLDLFGEWKIILDIIFALMLPNLRNIINYSYSSLGFFFYCFLFL